MAVHKLQKKRHKCFVVTNTHHPAVFFYSFLFRICSRKAAIKIHVAMNVTKIFSQNITLRST